jgi:sentrin-specific protease 1
MPSFASLLDALWIRDCTTTEGECAKLKAALTPEQMVHVNWAKDVRLGDKTEVIASRTFTAGLGMLTVTRKDVSTMSTGQWLNDEMVNFTIGIMADRELARCDGAGAQPRVHFFNTFFVEKLRGDDDMDKLYKWTTKKNIGYDMLNCHKVIIPVHQGIHWTLVVMDLVDKKVYYYDSLQGNDPLLTEQLVRWIVKEYANKRKVIMDEADWTTEVPENIPRQMNGCDCGVFMCKYADYIAMGCPLLFRQCDIEYFRRRITSDAFEQGKEAVQVGGESEDMDGEIEIIEKFSFSKVYWK